MAMYDHPRDLANHILASDIERHDLPDPSALRLGVVDVEEVFREDPEHSDFLYASLLRPLGGWFKPEEEHTPIAGTGRWGIIGTSEPLSMDTLNGYELVPVDAASRAASVLRAVLDRNGDTVPTLASAEGDQVPERIHIFTPVFEHEGDYSLVTFDENGPWGHRCYYEGDPYDLGAASMLKGIRDLLQGEREMISASIAARLVSDWCEEGDLAHVQT